MKKLLASIVLFFPLVCFAANPSYQDVTNIFNALAGSNAASVTTNYFPGNNVTFNLLSNRAYNINAVIPPNTNALTPNQTNVLYSAVTNSHGSNFDFIPENYLQIGSTQVISGSQIFTSSNWFTSSNIFSGTVNLYNPVFGSDTTNLTTSTPGSPQSFALQLNGVTYQGTPIPLLSAVTTGGAPGVYAGVSENLGGPVVSLGMQTVIPNGSGASATWFTLTDYGELMPNTGLGASIGDNTNPVAVMWVNALDVLQECEFDSTTFFTSGVFFQGSANFQNTVTIKSASNTFSGTNILNGTNFMGLSFTATGFVTNLTSTTAVINTETAVTGAITNLYSAQGTINNLATSIITNGYMILVSATNVATLPSMVNSNFIWLGVVRTNQGKFYVSSNGLWFVK
jgi:hypothetical protein